MHCISHTALASHTSLLRSAGQVNM